MGKAMSRRGRDTEKKVTTIAGVKEIITDMAKGYNKLTGPDRLKALKELDFGEDFFVCEQCSQPKARKDFYVATNNKTGVTRVCKECCTSLAFNTVNGKPSKNSVDKVLYMIDKPFLESVWDSAVAEVASGVTTRTGGNVWASYIRTINANQYYGLTYRDSDGFTGGKISLENLVDDALPKDQEIISQFEKNKADTLRLLGYEPFEQEKLSDQPFLYSQLIGFLDSSEQGNDDMMRTSSIITIVRSFLQISQIDDTIAALTADLNNLDKNIATIKQLQETKQKISMSITKLAEDSCISLKHNKNSVKGENTWTGKLKKIKELNLREGRNNGFDMETCRGMKQVQEISDASIMKQLALDETEWSDMVAELRTKVRKLQDEKDSYQEINRLLLQENLDLKDLIDEQNLDIGENILNLRDVYSTFSDTEDEDAD